MTTRKAQRRASARIPTGRAATSHVHWSFVHTGYMRYADSRTYLVPEDLADLTGPTSGVIELPTHLDWSEQHTYDLGDPAQTGLMYERVLREASSPRDLASYLNKDVLIRIWGRLYLPTRVRRQWESAFPVLARAAA